MEPEPLRTVGRLADGLVESVEGVGILTPDCLDSGCVVEVLAELVVRFALRERSLLNQVVGSIEVVVLQVVPQQQIQQGRLPQLIVSDAGSVVCVQNLLSLVQVGVGLLVQANEVEVHESTVGI